ncbi:MAG: hypothetical protein HFH69_12555 [Lachnospiraceae bacterium]|nr:hypothetical protein [Lachnospiraceae bacterium]
MAYKWCGMQIIPWEKVKKLHEKGELAGYYQLYPDSTEAQIGRSYRWEDIQQHYDTGGEFGQELETVELILGDGKPIKAPVVIDISGLGGLDELEYELWDTIQKYFQLFGIRMEDDTPDWATVKAVQDKIIGVLEESGVKFKFLTDEQQEMMEDVLKEVSGCGDKGVKKSE